MQRRQFIAGCSVACAAIGAFEIPSLLAGGGAVKGATTAGTMRDRYAALVGSRFRVYRGTKFADTITLSRVVDGPAKDKRLEQFTLVFGGTYRPDLATGTYSLVGTDGVSREMHLEPTADQTYRATFCLLTA
jgi:hypothetical protein